MRVVVRVGLATLLMTSIAGAAFSQAGKESSSERTLPPEWVGMWRPVRQNLPAGLKAVNPDLDAIMASHMQPWALAKKEATDLEAGDTGIICKLTGPFRQFSSGPAFTLIPSPGRITLIMGSVEVGGVRRIYMNQSHPANLRPTWNGHSVGRWEGGTLVVDTVGFNDKSWLYSDRWPHTEALHIVERFKPVSDGKLIEIQVTAEDPMALTSPFSYTRYVQRVDAEAQEDVCNEAPLVWLKVYTGGDPR
jgi:hypothetical protein